MTHRPDRVGTAIFSGDREETVDTATEEEILAELAANGFDLERIERGFVSAERNDEYFRAHQWELFERYPDRMLLIHSGGIVEPFDDMHEIARRYRELDQPIRDGAITRRQYKGILIL